jgi:hypothetical protein
MISTRAHSKVELENIYFDAVCVCAHISDLGFGVAYILTSRRQGGETSCGCCCCCWSKLVVVINFCAYLIIVILYVVGLFYEHY